MKRAGGACAVVLVLSGLCAPRAIAAPAFSHAVVASAVRTGEPKVFVDNRTRPPTIYVAAPEASTQIWRSANGGATFSKMAATGGGSGDSDVVVDANGTLYVADLFGKSGTSTFPVSTSYDRGRTYARIVDAAPNESGLDRPWISSNGAGHVVATANDVSGALRAWVSTDSARSFDGPFDIAKGITIQGPVVAGPRHTYYTIYNSGTDMYFAKSGDGVDWTTGVIARGNSSVLFPVIAVDRSANLYAVWSKQGNLFSTGPVYFSRSTNGGRTWSAPAVLSPATQSAIFPWVVAGSKGKVAVSYAVAHQAIGPDLGADLGGPQTTWDLVVSRTTNALSARPSWSSAVVERSFHAGSVCPDGTGCVGPQQFGFVNLPTPLDRRDLDFAGADVDAAGNVYVAFNRDRPLTTGDPNDIVRSQTDILLARQTGGQRLR